MKSISYLCATCGTQFPESAEPPARCPICEDDRQFVPRGGQQWITLEQLRRTHRNAFQYEADGLLGIGTTPDFAIGQRALLVKTTAGNILWDCISLIDDATRDLIAGLGGLACIAISHPHYYSGMVEWSQTFGGIPIYLHEDDRRWVMHSDPAIRFWQGDTLTPLDGITLIRCGGHFPGGTVLHWPAGASGAGALLTGDILQVAQDLRHVSFMYSYPNYIPLPASTVERIARRLTPYDFEQVHGAWWDRAVRSNGARAVQASARRYIESLRDSD